MPKITILETPAYFRSGGWIGKAAASIKRRGTAGKCTPMSKPGCTGRALALAKTFHKIARNRKKHEDGGKVGSENFPANLGVYLYGGQISTSTHPKPGSAFGNGGFINNPGRGQKASMRPQPVHYFKGGGKNYPASYYDATDNYRIQPIQGNVQASDNRSLATPAWYKGDYSVNDMRDSQGNFRTEDGALVNSPNNALGANTATQKGFGVSDIMSYAAPAYNLGMGLFGKPDQLNSRDYQTKIDAPRYVNPNTGARESLAAYRSGKQNVQGSLPGMVALNSQYQGLESDRAMKLGNTNAGIYNDWLSKKASIDQQNAQSRFQVDDWNERSKTMKDNFLSAAAGDISQIGQNAVNNNTYAGWYNDAFPNARKAKRGGRVMSKSC